MNTNRAEELDRPTDESFEKNPTFLTPEQLKAVTFLPSLLSPKKHLIIEAGAGSGKTKVLSERVKWLLTEAPVHSRINPNQIFLVTFTNDAQKELKERIESILTSPFLKQTKHLVHISTIDGLFDSLVDYLFPLWWEQNQTQHTQTMPPLVTLVSEAEVQRNLEKKVKDFLNSNNYSPHELALAIDFILAGGLKKRNSNFFSSANTLENILKCMCQDFFLVTNNKNIRIVSNKIHPATNSLISNIHMIARTQYENRIQKGEFTYADKTVFLKENLNNNLPLFIKELIVDEYQDTNSLQHEILYKLVENSRGRMVVVGDPKQSIYGFRGASVTVFKSLLENNAWDHIVLNKSFRTHEKLLDEINVLSALAFAWQNPRYPLAYKESFFNEEAQKKYIGENPLTSGKTTNIFEKHACAAAKLEEPFVYIVSTAIPPKTKEKLKINELSVLVYAEFLKELKMKDGIKWNEIVVLCEKNSQVKILRDAFLKSEIPVKNFEDTETCAINNYEDEVALALTKLLSNKADSFDLYIILMSPLINAPFEEVYKFMSAGLNEHTYPTIKNLFVQNEKFKLIAQYNFFLAWQRLRWSLISVSTGDKLFCANMDSFAKALFAELLNPNLRINLENSIFNGQKQNFILADSLSSYSLKKQKKHLPTQEDALDIRTIHKAKGLEWPYVCFYPKYGMQMQTGEFITSQSHNTLDISWLSQDTEGLSIVKRIENKHFNLIDSYTDENEKTVRFAEIRKQHEENYERQRVFYTAFTRPQKKLIFFQPTLHHSSKNGLRKFTSEKKEVEFYDYLEQDVFIKYLKKNFVFSFNENESPLKEVFYSHNKSVELTHYNLKEFSSILNENDIIKNTKIHNGVEDKQVNEILPLLESLPTLLNNICSVPVVKPRDDIIIKSQDDSELKSVDAPDLRWQNINQSLLQKKEQREKIHSGILFHASMESKKTNRYSILHNLEKKALICRREIEIWSKEKGVIKSKRNIIDMLLIISTNYFLEIFTDLRNSEYFNFPSTKTDAYVALAIDYKTGQKKEEHVDQILNYKKLTKLLLAEVSPITKIIDNVKIPVFGALVYIHTEPDQTLHFQNNLLTPALTHKHETIYLL